MNPWQILGWIVVGLVAAYIAARVVFASLLIVAAFVEWLAKRIMYLKTRNISPAKGQRWNQEGTILEIGERYPKGHFSVVVHAGMSRMSWCDTNESWKTRVRNRKLFLISE